MRKQFIGNLFISGTNSATWTLVPTQIRTGYVSCLSPFLFVLFTKKLKCFLKSVKNESNHSWFLWFITLLTAFFVPKGQRASMENRSDVASNDLQTIDRRHHRRENLPQVMNAFVHQIHYIARTTQVYPNSWMSTLHTKICPLNDFPLLKH